MQSGHKRIDKKGVVLLKFIPAIGQRKYDGERKQVVFLMNGFWLLQFCYQLEPLITATFLKFESANYLFF